MPLNIPALAAQYAALGHAITDSAWSDLTIRTGPTTVYTPATDATVTTWDDESEGRGLLYDATTEEFEATDTTEYNAWLAGRIKNLLLVAEQWTVPPAIDSLVEIDGQAWQVKSLTADPAGATFVLLLRR